MSEKLYNYESATMVLGCLFKQPSLMLRDDFNIKPEYFCDNFHRILYFGIRHLFNKGAVRINSVDFDIFISDYEELLEVCKDNNFIEVIDSITEICDVRSFDYYYDTFTKYSLLRYYRDLGYNISVFYDIDKDELDQRENLNNITKDAIIEYYERLNINAKKEFIGNNEIRELHIGDKLDLVIAKYEEAPLFGISTMSEYFNTACRGIIRGQFSCYSCPTGTGKTTIGGATMVNACCKEIFDSNKHEWVRNPHCISDGALYIQFELSPEWELSPKFLSAVTKVPTDHILNGTYEFDERERVEKGKQVLIESNIHTVLIPNFTLASINQIVEEYVITKKIDFVVFDYLSEQANLSREVAKSKGGVSTRSDQVLAALSRGLKDLGVKYDLSMLTFTQTNANIDNQEVLNESCVAGARAIADKLDCGVIIAPLRQNEYKISQEIINIGEEKGFNKKQPNRIIHCYKIRFGSEQKDIKIWGYLDLGTGEWTDCFVTDKHNKLYKMDKTRL